MGQKCIGHEMLGVRGRWAKCLWPSPETTGNGLSHAKVQRPLVDTLKVSTVEKEEERAER